MTLLDQTIGSLARDIPGASAIFRIYKLDFCCGGNKTLAAAAAERHLNTADLVQDLEQLAARKDRGEDWNAASDSELIAHILERYHQVHREQLPELIRLARRVETVHGRHSQCPLGLAEHLEFLQQELLAHMQKEEQVLFPLINKGMGGLATMPVRIMRSEHDDHADAIARIYQLTGDLQLPTGACNTWTALYVGLQALIADLMEHIHLENNILFNRIDGQ